MKKIKALSLALALALMVSVFPPIRTFAAIFFIVYFLIAAISWVTSGGDAGKLQNARERMLHGVMGLVIVVAAYGVIGLIGSINESYSR